MGPRQTFRRFLTAREDDDSVAGEVARDVLTDNASGCLPQVMVSVIRRHLAENHPEANMRAFERVVREWRRG